MAQSTALKKATAEQPAPLRVLLCPEKRKESQPPPLAMSDAHAGAAEVRRDHVPTVEELQDAAAELYRNAP